MGNVRKNDPANHNPVKLEIAKGVVREDDDVTLLIVQSKSRASRRGYTNWAKVE